MTDGFQAVLDHIRSIASTEAEKGRLFERLTKAYFRKDPVYRDRFRDVWLWSDWAARQPGFDGTDTGIDKPGDKTSPFVLVHDGKRIRAKHRLYMTATPRLYTQAAKTKASRHDVEVFSMDDEGTYGPEFHRLPFSRAVGQDLLADYKVVVFTLSEDRVDKAMQSGPRAEEQPEAAKVGRLFPEQPLGDAVRHQTAEIGQILLGVSWVSWVPWVPWVQLPEGVLGNGHGEKRASLNGSTSWLCAPAASSRLR